MRGLKCSTKQTGGTRSGIHEHLQTFVVLSYRFCGKSSTRVPTCSSAPCIRAGAHRMGPRNAPSRSEECPEYLPVCPLEFLIATGRPADKLVREFAEEDKYYEPKEGLYKLMKDSPM